MPLIVETSSRRSIEHDYAIDVLLGEFLGLDWIRRNSNNFDTRISFAEQPEQTLLLPDKLLDECDTNWLCGESLPKSPLKMWDTRELRSDIPITDPIIPVIYGDDEPIMKWLENGIRLPVDIFGSAFFMLTRYEELVVSDRDEHDRFPAWASLAFKESFLERPIIDEYVEILWAAIQHLWPRLKRKRRVFTVNASHDVDIPSRYGFKSSGKLILSMAGDVLKKGDVMGAVKGPSIKSKSKFKLHPKDPYNTFDWIMDISEKYGLTSTFFFFAGTTNRNMDSDYDIDYPAIRSLMRHIHQKSHQIGVHPSYETYNQPDLLKQEFSKFCLACEEENIKQKEWAGRMHFLRWDTATTMQILDELGMTFDCTLGYADHPGFRCGTCLEYPAFDVVGRSKLTLRLQPLIVMECSVIAEKYLGLRLSEEARKKITSLKKKCACVNGVFTLLWHNSELICDSQRKVYESVLAYN